VASCEEELTPLLRNRGVPYRHGSEPTLDSSLWRYGTRRRPPGRPRPPHRDGQGRGGRGVEGWQEMRGGTRSGARHRSRQSRRRSTSAGGSSRRTPEIAPRSPEIARDCAWIGLCRRREQDSFIPPLNGRDPFSQPLVTSAGEFLFLPVEELVTSAAAASRRSARTR